MASLT